MRVSVLPVRSPSPPPTRRRFLAALAFAASAHVAVLALGARRAPDSPANAAGPAVKVASVLVGRASETGDFVAYGFARARVRDR